MFTAATPEMILTAYHQGIFPMAESRDDSGFNFYRPDKRGLLPINDLHIPKSLLKDVKKQRYKVTVNTAFDTVINACAALQKNTKSRDNTWINDPIIKVFNQLHDLGHAHSIECWDIDNNFSGGLYGLAIGSVFCGESMVSNQMNASKIALVHLTARLHQGGFTLLDTQYINDHLKQFRAYEMPQEEYEKAIQIEMNTPANFHLEGIDQSQILGNYLEFRGL